MNLVIFPDNHDMKRIYTQVNEDYDLFQQAMIFVATMRGIPQYYYGTEILMGGNDDHGIIRYPAIFGRTMCLSPHWIITFDDSFPEASKT